MQYFLIDFENLPVAGLPALTENQTILIFTGENQTKVKMELVRSTQPLGKQVKWMEVRGSGNNALDFHIAFYIGRISQQEPGASFRILSGDKGFDPLIRKVNELGIACDRLDHFPVDKIGDLDIAEVVADLAAHFKGMDGKKRPQTIARLKGYIKNRMKGDADAMESVFAGLVEEKHIDTKDGKLAYIPLLI